MRITTDDIEYDDSQRCTYNGEWVTGEVYDVTPSGQVIGVGTYRNGIKDGPAREYHENGQLRLERFYRYGIPSGTHRKWYDTGQLEAEETYDDEGVLATRNEWTEDGELRSSWDAPSPRGG